MFFKNKHQKVRKKKTIPGLFLKIYDKQKSKQMINCYWKYFSVHSLIILVENSMLWVQPKTILKCRSITSAQETRRTTSRGRNYFVFVLFLSILQDNEWIWIIKAEHTWRILSFLTFLFNFWVRKISFSLCLGKQWAEIKDF